MIIKLLLLLIAMFLVVRGAILANKYAIKLANGFKLSKYVIGFLVVAIISILPETFISIDSSISGNPSFGLGTLFGSNVADLTLVFAIIIAFSGRQIKIESKILKNNNIYPFLFLLPIILGLDGYYSRFDGIALIVVGFLFYYFAFKNGGGMSFENSKSNGKYKSLIYLIIGIALLLLGAHLTVLFASDLAKSIGINPIFIGMFIVGLGTTIPELFFSLQSVKKHHDSLAVGDILGTVLTDATVVVGILALITPFYFPQRIIYITGIFMIIAAFVLIYFMRTGKVISKKEAWILLLFWISFATTELVVNILN